MGPRRIARRGTRCLTLCGLSCLALSCKKVSSPGDVGCAREDRLLYRGRWHGVGCDVTRLGIAYAFADRGWHGSESSMLVSVCGGRFWDGINSNTSVSASGGTGSASRRPPATKPPLPKGTGGLLGVEAGWSACAVEPNRLEPFGTDTAAPNVHLKLRHGNSCRLRGLSCKVRPRYSQHLRRGTLAVACRVGLSEGAPALCNASPRCCWRSRRCAWARARDRTRMRSSRRSCCGAGELCSERPSLRCAVAGLCGVSRASWCCLHRCLLLARPRSCLSSPCPLHLPKLSLLLSLSVLRRSSPCPGTPSDYCIGHESMVSSAE